MKCPVCGKEVSTLEAYNECVETHRKALNDFDARAAEKKALAEKELAAQREKDYKEINTLYADLVRKAREYSHKYNDYMIKISMTQERKEVDDKPFDPTNKETYEKSVKGEENPKVGSRKIFADYLTMAKNGDFKLVENEIDKLSENELDDLFDDGLKVIKSIIEDFKTPYTLI